MEIKEIKSLFMAYRNGIVADVYRKAGISCYNIIFGLNLPQLKAIAAEAGKDAELAQTLWDDKGVRESRLLSTWLWPQDALTPDLVAKLHAEAQTKEETDYLTLNLKR